MNAEPIRAAAVSMGGTDAAQSLDGWSSPDTRAGWQGARWIEAADGVGRVALGAPDQPLYVGLELYVPGGPRFLRRTLKLRVCRRGSPEQCYLDVEYPLQRGRWQVVDLKLPAEPPAGEEIEVCITVERLALRWPRPKKATRGRGSAAVKQVWLRGNRLEARDVTIVVLNWNRPDETIACLQSLYDADLEGASVLVVDNGSTDGSVEQIRGRFPDQEILVLPENLGYAGGNNAGLLRAIEGGAKGVLLLNNDTVVSKGFLAPLLWGMNSNVKAAAVSSAIMRMDCPEILDCAYLELYWGHGIVYQRGVNALPGEGFDTFREVDVAIGCSVLMSADTVRDIGPLDADYFAYHEEVDWCFRARQAGYHIYYQPYSVIWHGMSKSTARKLEVQRTVARGPQLANPMELSWNPVRAYLGARNTVRFVRKNGNWRQRAFFWLSSAYNVPLELTAAVLRREDALKIGAWSLKKALRTAAFGEREDFPPGAGGTLLRIARAPVALFWDFPRQALSARREGRTAQVGELLRGLWDGILDRPLPLRRLGLQ